MRYSMFAVFIGLTIFSGQAYALSCQDLKKANIEFVGYYFKEAKPGNLDEGAYRSNLLRKSVAAFYGDIPSTMSDEKVNELGEGVAFALVKDPAGADYQAVYVGFGGGNKASYFYSPGTLNLLSIMSYDGDCVDQGRSSALPFEEVVANPVEHKMSCGLDGGGLIPFKKLTFSVKLTPDGKLYSRNGEIKLEGSKEIVAGVTVNLPEKAIALHNVRLATRAKQQIWEVSFTLDGKKGDTKWQAQVSFLVDNRILITDGKLFPVVNGGISSMEAQDMNGLFTCDKDILTTGSRYQRVISY